MTQRPRNNVRSHNKAWGLADSSDPTFKQTWLIIPDPGYNFAGRHSNKVNMWFFDGHAAATSPHDVKSIYSFHSGLSYVNIKIDDIAIRY